MILSHEVTEKRGEKSREEGVLECELAGEMQDKPGQTRVRYGLLLSSTCYLYRNWILNKDHYTKPMSECSYFPRRSDRNKGQVVSSRRSLFILKLLKHKRERERQKYDARRRVARDNSVATEKHYTWRNVAEPVVARTRGSYLATFSATHSP